MIKPLTERQKKLAEQHLQLARRTAYCFMRRYRHAQQCRDLINDAAITHLLFCARDYDPRHGASFDTFYLTRAFNRMFTVLDYHIRRERKLFRIRKEAPAVKRHQNRTSAVDAFIAADQVRTLIEKSNLSDIERRAIEDFLTIGRRSRTEIALGRHVEEGISKKGMQTRLHRAITKMRKCEGL